MKVLELCLSPSFGGLEIYVCRVIEALGQQHEVIAVAAPGSRIQARLQASGFAVETLHTRLPRLPLRAAAWLARFFDRQAVDLVHVNWGPDLALAAFAKRMSRRRPRLVYTRHMLMNRPKRDPYHGFVYGQYDCILAISAHMEEGLRRHLPIRLAPRIRHLYCGVPAPGLWLSEGHRNTLRREWGFPPEAFIAGVFSRLERAKGQHLLLDAINLLRDRGVTVHGLIVGHAMDEAYSRQLRDQVRALGLRDRIVFRDFVDQPQVLVQACDCLVLPTDRETFANIVSEAMRAGVSVISSDQGGMPEMIEHGRSGLLFESGNAAHLAEQLHQLHDDPEHRAALAAAGRDRADRLFSIEQQLPRLEALFQSLVAAGPAQGSRRDP